jgi:zinc/manganese transport system substrate-binding protein
MVPNKRRAVPFGAGLVAVLVSGAGLSACGGGDRGGVSAGGMSAGGVVSVVAAENQYGDVAARVGGRYVKVATVENNPNTDPHNYEISPRVASEVAEAALVIVNGVGYDAFLDRIEAAVPNRQRRTLSVQHLLGLPDTTPNPHLWYRPTTMPRLAQALASDLGSLVPSHASYFRANAARFTASLQPWQSAIAGFRARYAGAPVATTEPVADYLLEALGLDNRTPFAFQADVMNGTDPTPQTVALVEGLLIHRQVRAFVYNEQVVDPLTVAVRSAAIKAHIPVVGVYETMPAEGYHYQSWMRAETDALAAAVGSGRSSERL